MDIFSTDDQAIFVDTTIDDAQYIRKNVSTSPSAMVILSPPKSMEGYSAHSAGVCHSAERQQHRQALAERPIVAASATPQKLHFTTPVRTKIISTSAHKERTPPPVTSHYHAANDVAVPEAKQQYSHAEVQKLKRELTRALNMLEYQKEINAAAEQRAEEDREKMQCKISDVIALSSRLEENKRFVRQLKKELLECKRRMLPYQNEAVAQNFRPQQGANDAEVRQLRVALQEKTEELEQFKAGLGIKMDALEQLSNDLFTVDGTNNNPLKLLSAAYEENGRLMKRDAAQQKEAEWMMESLSKAEEAHGAVLKEKQELEAAWLDERRRIRSEDTKRSQYIRDLQNTIAQLLQKQSAEC